MRRVILFSAVVALWLQALPAALAHAPADATAVLADRTLIVTVSHMVSDPASHYVRRIQISSGGTQLATKDFTRQTDSSVQRVELPLEGAALKTGDTIEVEVFCSRYGSLKKTVTLE